MMPSYLSFVKAIVIGGNPLTSASRETLQQHKILKVIRRILDMVTGALDDRYSAFWTEPYTNIRLSVSSDMASLTGYIEMMKNKRGHIIYMSNDTTGEGEAADRCGLHKFKDVTREGPRGSDGTWLASSLIGGDGLTWTKDQEDNQLIIHKQHFDRDSAINM